MEWNRLGSLGREIREFSDLNRYGIFSNFDFLEYDVTLYFLTLKFSVLSIACV